MGQSCYFFWTFPAGLPPSLFERAPFPLKGRKMADTTKDVSIVLIDDSIQEIYGGTESRSWPQNEKHTVKFYLQQPTWILGIGLSAETNISINAYFYLPGSKERYLAPGGIHDPGYFEQIGQILPKGGRVDLEFEHTAAQTTKTVYSSVVVRRYQ